MIINRVTFSGADESVTPEQLWKTQEQCLFIEWGILLSASSSGNKPRYPSTQWVDYLMKIEELPMLSGHLCGQWVRDLLKGNFTYAEKFPNQFSQFGRIQLNFRGCDLSSFVNDDKRLIFYKELSRHHHQFIFQIGSTDNLRYNIFDNAKYYKVDNVSPLFDCSGGRGMTPPEWPRPISHFCGYAGGLGPDNLVEEIKRIADVVGNGLIWIDFETKVRSNDDKLFDLDKVRKCYDILQPYLQQ